MSNRIDFEGVFRLLPPHGAVKTGYRPQHLLHENYQSSGTHTYPDRDLVNPDESVPVQVQMISPEVYPCCIWEGRVLSIFEGARVVGELTVSRIFNDSLRVIPEHYKPMWEEPAHLPEKA